MTGMGRREFLKSSIGAAAALSAVSPSRSAAASDKVVLGIMGVGGRGTLLAGWFAQMPDVEIAYLCDVNERRFDRALERVETSQGKTPELVKDFRRILDDKNVDALVNATPDHWHALGSIMACQAGKDVYVEKPLSQCIWEGSKMIEAARKYERVVQVGTQTRSSAYVQKGIEYIKAGKLGEVHLVRVNNFMMKPPREKGPEEPVPDGLDWDMWCGPAPLLPYSPGQWWMDLWDFNTGTVANEIVHQLDLARMLVGIGCPTSVYQAGGVHFFNDGREIPDTYLATFEYGDLTLMMEAAVWTPYIRKIPNSIRDSDRFPDWPFTSTRVEIYGSEGMMNFGRQGGGWQACDKNGELVHSEPGRQGDQQHLRNFIDCIRQRRTPAADVEQGHFSTLFCHLANVSYRVGHRKLEFDPQSHAFVGDEEANRYLKRDYRKPWVVPDKV